MSRAQAYLQMRNSALSNLDNASNYIGVNKIDDLQTRILVTGSSTGFHEVRYLTEQAIVFNALGLGGQALLTLNSLRNLYNETYRKDETRWFAWIDIIAAESYMKMKEYSQACRCAINALSVCKDIKSFSNIHIITDIYGRLLHSPYRSSNDIQDLGEMLQNRS